MMKTSNNTPDGQDKNHTNITQPSTKTKTKTKVFEMDPKYS